jgi:hypothetical protein
VGLAVLVSDTPAEQVLETALENGFPNCLGGDRQGEGNGNETSDNVKDVTQSTDRSTSVGAGKAETTRVSSHQKGSQIKHEVVSPGIETTDAAVGNDMHLEAIGKVLNSLR